MDRPRVFVSAADRRRAVAVLAGLAVAVGLTGVLVAASVPRLTDPAWLERRIAAAGPLAPLAFVCLQAVQVLVAPVPGQALGGVAGYLFGPAAGTVYSLAGVAIGGFVAFGLTRRYGRPYVERAVDPAALDRFDGFVERHGRTGLFAAFLFPAFPDDLLCFVAGLSEIQPRTFLALLVVGRAPSFLAVAVAGGRLAAGARSAAVALTAGLAVVTLAGYYVRVRLTSSSGGTPDG